MTREEMEELKGLAASMGLYDDKNPCKRAVILGKAIKALEQEPIGDRLQEAIKLLGEDIRICQKSITDEKVLIGFNMAVAICNKHLAESEKV